MNIKKKAKHIAEILENLFPETPIPLQHTDTYTLLIAVLVVVSMVVSFIRS